MNTVDGSLRERVIADLRRSLADRPADLASILDLYEKGHIEPAIVDGSYGWRLTARGRHVSLHGGLGNDFEL